MSMSGDSIDKLYFSQSNLDNTFKQVSEEINRRTNKDVSQNTSYKKSFQEMAKMVYDKCPPLDRNLQNVNTILIDKSVIYFHNKIFSKNTNNPTEKQENQALRESIIRKASAGNNNNISTQHGFSMIKENEDLNGKYEQVMAQRAAISNSNGGNNGGNNGINNYMPPVIKSSSFVNSSNPNNRVDYESQFKRVADNKPMNQSTLQTPSQMNKQNADFTINSFNLNDDITSSLFNAESVDSPLYQNIENLQKMDGTNPMSILEDYQRQRNQQINTYSEIEKRENITASRSQPINHNSLNNNNVIFNRNNTNAETKIDNTQVDPMELYNFGNKLTNDYSNKIEERIINNNEAQPSLGGGTFDLAKMQADLIKLQRDTQPKYIEKVHYINVNSVDRLWETNAESRFSFKVQFNQGSGFEGAAISQLYKNIVSVELVSAILPMDTTINTFDTRIYGGLMKFPYLLLRIDELDSVFRGTNNWADRAFSTLLFDKVYFSNTFSTDYINGTNGGTSIVNSAPKTSFNPEYLRGFLKFNPAYFEKKKFYNNPLASLNRMTITITDPRGNFINDQSDVLIIQDLTFTNTLNNVTGLEISASNAFPYFTQSTIRMIQITSTTKFSNRLFRVGDRVLVRDFATNTALATNNSIFNSFINQTEGHIIVNLDLENNADLGNKSFIQKLYISPPGTYNSTSNTVVGYYDNTGGVLDLTGATFGSLINMDLQSHLLFRIVTRDPDTSGVMKPINVY